eukprot:TRINITY_DN88690_c0_g1_i1.p1 TRINITY_DN88690_c0_g1~~TRINITY_DN88690_c0_g1_i1.p1  ORF type:complete len:270 (+),score=-7.78 TRINITY_DN88690_c0_g1_i1:513-1322(+)
MLITNLVLAFSCAFVLFTPPPLVCGKVNSLNINWETSNRAHHRRIFQSNTTILQGGQQLIEIVREISPVELAGQFSTFYLLLSRCGSLVAYLVGIGLPSSKADIDYSQNNYWRYMLGFPLVIIALQTALLLFIYVYETPKYLYFHRRRNECEEALSKIYNNKDTITRVMVKLKALQLDECGHRSSGVTWRELFGRTYLKALIVVLSISHFNDPSIRLALLSRTRRRKRHNLILEHNLQKQPCQRNHSADRDNPSGRYNCRRRLFLCSHS